MPASGNVGVAFALVLGAGASTALGAATVFYKKTSPIMLAMGLGAAAGVMLYVSMVEIFLLKGVGSLSEGGWGEDGGYRGGTILLFVGMIMTYILNLVAHAITDYAYDDSTADSDTKMFKTDSLVIEKKAQPLGEGAESDMSPPHVHLDLDDDDDVDVDTTTRSVECQVSPRQSTVTRPRGGAGGQFGPGAEKEPWMLDSFRRPSLPRVTSRQQQDMHDIEDLMRKKAAREQRMERMEMARDGVLVDTDADEQHSRRPRSGTTTDEHRVNLPPAAAATKEVATRAPVHTPDDQDRVNEILTDGKHQAHLQKMGLLTALSIAIHNVPEGLATFVAALNDPLNAIPIALAISLHNIPEGVCVAVPIFYATGDRWKGFWWATASGASELIGGLLGYTVLYGNRMSDVAYGVLFCLVAGMMVYICLMELIPTALKFDVENRVTSRAVMVGMAVMAISLLMFTTSGLS